MSPPRHQQQRGLEPSSALINWPKLPLVERAIANSNLPSPWLPSAFWLVSRVSTPSIRVRTSFPPIPNPNPATLAVPFDDHKVQTCQLTPGPDEPSLSVQTVALFSVHITLSLPCTTRSPIDTYLDFHARARTLTNPSQIALTLLYVVPFYLSPSTRPSPSLSRDAPSVIRARIRTVTGSCLICSLVVLWLVVDKSGSSLSAAVSLLGWWPIDLGDILRSLLLTVILFVGPLYEHGIVEGEWRSWFSRAKWSESLGGWIGWRNYIAVCSISSLSSISSISSSTPNADRHI